jgi:hypothetical protein
LQRNASLYVIEQELNYLHKHFSKTILYKNKVQKKYNIEIVTKLKGIRNKNKKENKKKKYGEKKAGKTKEKQKGKKNKTKIIKTMEKYVHG